MKKKTVDEKDIKILNILQENSFITNQELAKALNLSPSPTLRRVENLWKNNILSRYRATINLLKFGYNHGYMIKITLLSQVEEALTEELVRIKSCFYIFRADTLQKISDTCALIVINVCKSSQENEETLTKIRNFRGVVAMDVLELQGVVKDSILLLDDKDQIK